MKIAVKNLDEREGAGDRAPRRGLRLPVQGAPHPRRGARRTSPAQRAGTHKTKIRGEVAGAGRSCGSRRAPAARASASIRSPLWRKGGTVHGPVPRSYDQAPVGAARRSNALQVGAVAQAQGRGDRGGRQPRAREPQDRDARQAAGRARHRGQGAPRRPPRQRRTSTLASRNNPRLKTVDALAVNVYDVVDRGTWCSASRRSGGWWRCSRDEDPGRHPPPADHREVDPAARGRTTSIVFEVDRGANKIEIKRAVEASSSVKVAEVRVAGMHGKERRQGRFAGQPPGLEEGLRPAGAEDQKHRVLRGHVRAMGIKKIKPTNTGQPLPEPLRLRGAHAGAGRRSG